MKKILAGVVALTFVGSTVLATMTTAEAQWYTGIVLGVTVAVGVIAVGDTADGAWVLGRLRLAR